MHAKNTYAISIHRNYCTQRIVRIRNAQKYAQKSKWIFIKFILAALHTIILIFWMYESLLKSRVFTNEKFSFRLNHMLWGLQPWFYHAFNVGIHALCCALFTRVALTVAKLQTNFAAAAGILFAAHPIHTEAVSNV